MIQLGQQPPHPPQQPRRVGAPPEQRVRMPQVHLPHPQAGEHRGILGPPLREQRGGVVGAALAQPPGCAAPPPLRTPSPPASTPHTTGRQRWCRGARRPGRVAGGPGFSPTTRSPAARASATVQRVADHASTEALSRNGSAASAGRQVSWRVELAGGHGRRVADPVTSANSPQVGDPRRRRARAPDHDDVDLLRGDGRDPGIRGGLVDAAVVDDDDPAPPRSFVEVTDAAPQGLGQSGGFVVGRDDDLEFDGRAQPAPAGHLGLGADVGRGGRLHQTGATSELTGAPLVSCPVQRHVEQLEWPRCPPRWRCRSEAATFNA